MTDHRVRLVDPDGVPLEVVLVDTGALGDVLTAVLEIQGSEWVRVESRHLLHVDLDRVGASATVFDESRPVQLDAALVPDVAASVRGDLAAALLSSASEGPLHRTDAWWTLSATQEVELSPELRGSGTLREGIEFERPAWLPATGGAEGLDAAWAQALEAIEDELDDPQPMLSLVVDVFAEGRWEVDRPRADETVLHATVAGDPIDWDLWVRTDEEHHIITAYAVLATDVPRARIAKVVELASRLNGRTPLGSYEANPDDGLLSFKSAIDVTGDDVSYPLVRRLIGAVLAGGERALGPYLAVVHEGARPSDVVAALDV